MFIPQILLLFFLSAAITACASTGAKSGGGLAAEVSVEEWNLSPDSERLYFRLLLSEALETRDEALAGEAIRGILNITPSIEVFRECAAMLIKRRQFDSAHAVIAEGLKLFPKDPMLTLGLAEICTMSGNYRESAALLRDYLLSVPDDYAVMLELSRIHLLNDSLDSAEELLAKIPRKERGASYDLFQARLFDARGNPAAARKKLLGLLKENPEFTPAWLELALVYSKEDKRTEALDAYGKALELEPDSPGIRMQLVRLQILWNMPEEALAGAEEAPSTPSFLLQAAGYFLEGGYPEQAGRLLDAAARKGGSRADLAVLRSRVILDSTSDSLAAAGPLGDVPSGHPAYGEAAIRKTQLLSSAGELDEAGKTIMAALDERPEIRALWGTAAYILIRQGKEKRAMEVLDKALERFPEDSILLYSYGRVLHEAGKREKAIKIMERLISIDPGNAEALNYVGYYLAEQGADLGRALSLVTAALAVKPGSGHMLDSLAWIQYKMGRCEEAWKNIVQCIASGIDDAEVWEHYADIAQTLGKTDEAGYGLENALRHEPPNAKALRARLDKIKQGAIGK